MYVCMYIRLYVLHTYVYTYTYIYMYLGLIDYDEVSELAKNEKPRIIIAGGSAYARHIDFARFRQIADAVGAYLLVDMAHFSGLVAGGAYPSPLPHAHVVTSTTHKVSYLKHRNPT